LTGPDDAPRRVDVVVDVEVDVEVVLAART